MLDNSFAFVRAAAAWLLVVSACESHAATGTERERPDATSVERHAAEEMPPPSSPTPRDLPRLGIASCDRHIAAFADCVEQSAPEQSKPALRKALRETVETWRAITNPSSSEHVELICRDAYAAAQTQTRAWGCELAD